MLVGSESPHHPLPHEVCVSPVLQRSTGSVSQFSNVQQPGRRLLQSTSSIEVRRHVVAQQHLL